MAQTMADLIQSTFARSGLSIRQLAKRADLSYATAHGLIRGNIDPRLTAVERVSEVLGLELRVRRGKAKATVR